ncbi:MAG: DUF6660 family protein [Flavipsychrobacter sp.]
MRLTASILAILVLILSCLPCADMGAMPITKVDNSSLLTKPVKEHSDNHKEVDLCSPFCHCACCAGFSIIYSSVVIPDRIQIVVPPLHTDFISSDVIEISLPIWQPPQLV